jgi:hypothetical protein
MSMNITQALGFYYSTAHGGALLGSWRTLEENGRMLEVSLQVMVLSVIVGTIATARARRLRWTRVALAYLGGMAGMIITSKIAGAPFMIVAHGNRPAASRVAAGLLLVSLAAGVGAGVVLMDRKRSSLRWHSLRWVLVGSALAVVAVSLSVALQVALSSWVSGAALLLLLLLPPVFGWAATAANNGSARSVLGNGATSADR